MLVGSRLLGPASIFAAVKPPSPRLATVPLRHGAARNHCDQSAAALSRRESARLPPAFAATIPADYSRIAARSLCAYRAALVPRSGGVVCALAAAVPSSAAAASAGGSAAETAAEAPPARATASSAAGETAAKGAARDSRGALPAGCRQGPRSRAMSSEEGGARTQAGGTAGLAGGETQASGAGAEAGGGAPAGAGAGGSRGDAGVEEKGAAAGQAQDPAPHGAAEDPLVQHVVVRRDLVEELKWPLGSVIAQGCHASVAAIWRFQEHPEVQQYCREGAGGSMRKVVLEVKGEPQLRALSERLSAAAVDHCVWEEQPENTATCLATRPQRRGAVQQLLKKLRLFR